MSDSQQLPPGTPEIEELFRLTEHRETAEAHRVHSLVLDSMTEGVSVSDENGIILYTNPAEDRMFGYERGELIGQHVTVQNTYQPEENVRIVNEVIAQLKEQGVWFGEFSNRKKDGTAFITFARITALDISDKRYLVCVQEDVTGRKREEEILRASEGLYSTSIS
jgi:PAS domain S-box-containing protein